jgi:repressor LexA
MNLTPKQKEIYNFIVTWQTEKHYTPSYFEIMKGIGSKSKSSVARHLEELEYRGYIHKPHTKHRDIRILK